MILVDTSAWVEYLRGTGSAEAICVRDLLDDDAPLACCDPIRMELLAGARDERHVRILRQLLARARTLPTTAADYEVAAGYVRACRSRGITVRRTLDCLVAAVAVAHDIPVLHRDRDFAALATVVPLNCHRL
jgi:predicted nucleic acid-binding protein